MTMMRMIITPLIFTVTKMTTMLMMMKIMVTMVMMIINLGMHPNAWLVGH